MSNTTGNIIFVLGNMNSTSLVNTIVNRVSETTEPLRVGLQQTQKFSDGELCVDYLDSVRGKRVFILSSPNTSDEIMLLNLAIDAAKRGAAKEIIPILPYFPYARQDKKDQSRGPIGAKIIAEMIENRGATSVITFDLHADQIQGFFNIPIIHIEGKNVFNDYISELNNGNLILCGPDAGSGKRVKRMQKQLLKSNDISVNYVMLDKTRTEANKVDSMIIIGDVTGKDVIILDDMVDTAGTLCKAAEVLLDGGAKTVRAIIGHPVLSGPAYERVEASKLTELVVSDSLPIKESTKIKVVSVAEQISKAIVSIIGNLSYDNLKEIKKYEIK